MDREALHTQADSRLAVLHSEAGIELDQRSEDEGRAGTNAACQQSIHARYLSARKGAKRQARQRVVQIIMPEGSDDAIPAILQEPDLPSAMPHGINSRAIALDSVRFRAT
jgi:hypothetical protein